jgi:hypothetical protein
MDAQFRIGKSLAEHDGLSAKYGKAVALATVHAPEAAS